jgi:hypothetical protein
MLLNQRRDIAPKTSFIPADEPELPGILCHQILESLQRDNFF